MLIAPDPRLRRSFLDTYAEIAADPAHGPADADRWLGLTSVGYLVNAQALVSPTTFEHFCAALRRSENEDAPRPDGYVPETPLWWVEGEHWLGRLSIRHRLTPFLRDVGGHIGYLVRPSVRRHGHATAMLAAALPVAYGLGIDPVLVTCDEDNHASRRVIETAGGRLEDQRGVKLRYWVATAPR